MRKKSIYNILEFLINLIPLKKLKLKIGLYKKNGNIINVPIKRLFEIDVSGSNNEIQIDKEVRKSDIKINIIGNGNKIIINKTSNLNVVITIKNGNNNNFIFGEGINTRKFNLHTSGGVINNTTTIIGNNTIIMNAVVKLQESDISLTIGKDCLISFDVYFLPTDCHTIIDNTTKKVINKADKITIGNHVWIGKGTTILKNTTISNNCILGAGSIVSGKFLEENIVIAGNPAKKIKENVNWNKNLVQDYIEPIK